MTWELVLDYETRSEADLKKVGAFEYANHPTTEVLCVAWRWKHEEEKARVWSPFFRSSYGELMNALLDPGVMLTAHNAFFEQVITRFAFTRLFFRPGLKEIPVSRWNCTAARAAALALPRSLEGAGSALGLPVQKDPEGRKLVLRYCKPRKPTKADPSRWHEDLEGLGKLMAYCARDVDTEVELARALPELTLAERKVWELDQKMNWLGFRVDRPFVSKALELIDAETARLNSETETLTLGIVENTRRRDALLEFIRSEGVPIEDLKAKTVKDTRAEGTGSAVAQRLLEIRAAVSKTSTAKYAAFEARSRTDGRVRDNLVYHGASTGRWTGAGLQIQNFPRGLIKDSVQALEIVREGDLELIRLLYGDPMEVFSSCLRPVIQASEGKTLYCADYSAIEARVLFWLAKHEAGLAAFLAGKDLYREMAARIFGIPLEQVTKDQRELGKRAILGCGYQMGAAKFAVTCDVQGQPISEDLAKVAVSAYREKHWPVPQLWSNLERAALAAVRNPGNRYTVNRTTWFRQGRFLWCRLPSGRCLAYADPAIRTVDRGFGPKESVHHWGVDSISKKWVFGPTYGGRLAENVCQATARDVMAEALLRLDGAGFDCLTSVHDEALAEAAPGRLDTFMGLFSALPPWAEGLPLKAEGWTGPRYRK